MINDLDNILTLNKFDSSNTIDSIRNLSSQCRQAWDETQALMLPKYYENIKNIIVSGMGGSSYGVRIIKSLYDGAEYTKVPLELANGYWLPGYVDGSSLVILSSYSGATEETLEVARQAHRKKTKIIGLTTGGKLAAFLSDNNYPSYIFNPIYNPCKQPRFGVGYMVIGLTGILAKLKKIPVGSAEIRQIISLLDKQTLLFDSKTFSGANPAKQLARKLFGKIPVLVVADFLEGAAYAVRNQLHETSKQLALHFFIPEANHHLMEGLGNPKEIKKHLLFIFIHSSIYGKRNSQRVGLTIDVVRKNNLETEEIFLKATSFLSQVMEFIQIGSWTAFYLAMLNKVDPAKIPWVKYFKEKLKSISE